MPPTSANLKYAERLVAEIKEKIRLSTFSMAEYFRAAGDGGKLTVGAQLDTWLKGQRIEESTRAGYESCAKFWKITGLGDKALRALRTSDILTALATRPDLSGKTVNNYVQVLREAVELAVTDKILVDNPVIKVPHAKHQKEPPDPFSREEMEKVLVSLADKHPGQVSNFTEFWFWTGMRTSEIFGLRWDNVDLASGLVVVREAVVRGVQKDRTKTNVERTVNLNSRALAAIQRQREHTQVAGEHVFTDPRYRTAWVDERAYRRSFWTPTLKILGVRYRRPYNMRHTYATVMLMAGMNPAFCAKQLGHSVEMFHKTYAKWLDGDQNVREMARLETTLCPSYAQKKIKAP
ncbi:Putative defective protein IntQ [Polaromonas vacuolata]|uniref:Defective protein IntQ n=2 Tax=Polaromonas vacuolata TaxID=37448 RepID=A0A6H2H893_9BURK|nr:Putative defective protein IntQ [Polaromonas vacuolata]